MCMRVRAYDRVRAYVHICVRACVRACGRVCLVVCACVSTSGACVCIHL